MKPKVHGIDCLFDESKDCETCEANPNIKAPAPAHTLRHKDIWAEKEQSATAPAPLRNEDRLCRDCGNRHDCGDYKHGRTKACSDCWTPKQDEQTPTVERGFTISEIENWLRRFVFVSTIKQYLNDPQDGIEAVTNRDKKAERKHERP